VNAARFLAAALIAAMLLSACGNKGPLVLPKDDAESSRPPDRKP